MLYPHEERPWWIEPDDEDEAELLRTAHDPVDHAHTEKFETHASKIMVRTSDASRGAFDLAKIQGEKISFPDSV